MPTGIHAFCLNEQRADWVSANQFRSSALRLIENYDLIQGAKNLRFNASDQNKLFYSKKQQVVPVKPEEKDLLTNAYGIVLIFGDKMVGRPITKKSWPASSFAMSGHTHFIHCQKQKVVSGETVRITSNKSKDGYVYLYSSAKGWIYYDQQSSNKKQFWIIEKVEGTTGDEIRSGDKIQLRNAYYSDSYLRKYSDVYPSCEANSKGSKIVVEVQSHG